MKFKNNCNQDVLSPFQIKLILFKISTFFVYCPKLLSGTKEAVFGPAEFWEFLCCLKVSAVLNSLLADLHKRTHAKNTSPLGG